ncbi:FtsX-like permease family protein [Candidatus Micrarchaeota archaeon]|nr:FtsX-like permease family protein [Candidatus Micrarchaeota archaeon]
MRCAITGEISRMFLIESAILGLTGGAIGIAISVLVGLAADSLGVGLSLPTAGPGSRAPSTFLITPELIVFAIIFSAVIGMAAGYFPAKQAAKLNPVEALRYE